jgi:cation diffusion facilitator family transporter
MLGVGGVSQMTLALRNCFSAPQVQNKRRMSQQDATEADCPRSWLGEHHHRHERRTRWVVVLTLLMMVGEIAGGHYYGSLALVADGWHMGTHAAALGVAALAYRYARAHASNPRFTFGTGKVGDLAGFASAVSLGIVALLIGVESVQRLIEPRAIVFTQAIAIAVLGLVVNLVSAVMLGGGGHGHDHGDAEGQDELAGHDHDTAQDDAAVHDHGARPAHAHQDTNLRAAYVHVLADALTSVLAIAGLLAAMWLGWIWMDAAAGLIGAAVIVQWSVSLARDAGRTLLDAHDETGLQAAARARLLRAAGSAALTDLHLWRVGPGNYALMATLRGASATTPDDYRRALADLPQLRHVTVEINRT